MIQRKNPLTKVVMDAHRYLFLRSEVKPLNDEKNNLAKSLKKWLSEKGVPEVDEDNNETGDQILEFDEPLNIGGERIRGLRRKRQVTEYVDTDEAKKLLKEKDLISEVMHTETIEVWDWDELYRLNQEGKITDAELDAMKVKEESWSLVVDK